MGARRDDISAAVRMQIGVTMLAPNRARGEASRMAREHGVSRRTLYDIAAKTKEVLWTDWRLVATDLPVRGRTQTGRSPKRG